MAKQGAQASMLGQGTQWDMAVRSPHTPPQKKLYWVDHSPGDTGEAQTLGGALEVRTLWVPGQERTLEGSRAVRTLHSTFEGLARGLHGPRMAASLYELRTATGWFWIGAGLSPDIGASLPSSSALWCLKGPRGDGNFPRSRTERLWWHPPTPPPRRACRIPRPTRRRGDLCRLE